MRSELFLLLLCAAAIAAGQTEIPDNAVDEDGDGWLGTTAGFQLRSQHPRSLIAPEDLDTAVARMAGPSAREPYSRWYAKLQARADAAPTAVSLLALALCFKATGNTSYLETFQTRVDASALSSAPSLDELSGLDILFDNVSAATKTRVMQRAANANGFYYNSLTQSQVSDYSTVGWGYHSAIGVAPALMYAAAFALTPEEAAKDPTSCPFDAFNFFKLAVFQTKNESGHFRGIERRIAGDMTHNPGALGGGELGGLYDNFGYDTAEESFGILVFSEASIATGESLLHENLHEMHRGTFYQSMFYPYLFTYIETDRYCYKAETEQHVMARLWNTQTDWITQPSVSKVPITATLYKDRRMQYFALNGTQPELCTPNFGGLDMWLLWFNDSLTSEPPSTRPLASYFQGGGLFSTRSDWSNDASFAVFICGEEVSRRYEDANSFLLGRKGHVVHPAGARIRFNADNNKHHWYAVRSASKNTLKVFDPDETFDFDYPSGERIPYHTGDPLQPSDNLGGQAFQTYRSGIDLCYSTDSACSSSSGRSGSAFPFGIYERGNIVKYFHDPAELTYAVGDGAASYSEKISMFEREFLHLRPDTFVIFDRVRSANASFKKAWTVHSVDEPTCSVSPSQIGQGMRSWTNARTVTIASDDNVAFLHTLLPINNKLVVRGGDTVLGRGPLNPSSGIGASAIADIEIPRWVELLASGSDADGTVTITGDAEEGAGQTENVAFAVNKRQSAFNGDSIVLATTTATDSTQNWRTDQWVNYMLTASCGGSGTYIAMITSNNATTLRCEGSVGALGSCSAYTYTIFRYLANTQNHFTSINSVTTTNVDFEDFVLSVPHYFDTVDIAGRLNTFAPKTDGASDGYSKRTDFGQFTLEVETVDKRELDVFLNVFTLADPGVEHPAVSAVQGSGASGALIGETAVLFSDGNGTAATFSATLPTSDPVRLILFDAQPGSQYGCQRSGGSITCTAGGTGQRATANTMGIVRMDLAANATDTGGGSGDESGDNNVSSAWRVTSKWFAVAATAAVLEGILAI